MTQVSLRLDDPDTRCNERTLSTKLSRTLAALEYAGHTGLTTAELQRATDSMSVHADVYHLRQKLWRVSCEFERTSERGARVFRWRLVGPA